MSNQPMSIEEFKAELRADMDIFEHLVRAEEESGYEFEDTAERLEQAGYVTGMAHAFYLLTGEFLHLDAKGVERYVREQFKAERGQQTAKCEHDRYSASPIVCIEHGENADCYQRTCDNCNCITEHVENN